MKDLSDFPPGQISDEMILKKATHESRLMHDHHKNMFDPFGILFLGCLRRLAILPGEQATV